MDRYDLVEGVGIALLVAFAAVVWWPAAFLVAGVALIVEAQFRSLAAASEPAEDAEAEGQGDTEADDAAAAAEVAP